MNTRASLRKGWCPGALLPMPAGDGLLVRVRVAARPLALDCMEALADCAAQFGNGGLEISSRANLQLRGIREAALLDLQRRLDELGLLDADAAVESARNIVASPLSDVDAAAIVDVGLIVAALEERLRNDLSLRRLPPKFGLLVDGGGALPLGDVETDIRFEAFHGEDGPRLAVRLAGAASVAAVCVPRHVADVAAALARALLAEADDRGDAPLRMRALVAQRGAVAIFAAAGLAPLTSPPAPRLAASLGDVLGLHAVGARFCVGASVPLGRINAGDLRAVVQEAQRCSAIDIRLTPWRAFLVTGLDRSGAENLAATLAALGLILDPGDRRLAIVACTGGPACANAPRPLQAEALEFSRFVRPGRGIVVHVSGCAKGCAHGRAAPLTLIARAAGYDLVVNGRASDTPSRLALSKDEVVSVLTQYSREFH